MVHSPDALDLPREFGAYTLLKRLAVGGMAEVYVAKAQGIGGFEKLVAIKVIHPRLSEDEHFIQMLVEEAKLSVVLTHGNIAQTFDLGCIDDTYFIVMEYVDGADTYRILKRAEAQEKQMPLDICAYVVSEVANGLDYAHRKRDSSGKPLNVVHRDISPQNVLISHTGEVKIVDFGIAKAAHRTGQTEAGVIKGKYYYMSPEQAWGDPLDHRSDIFSLGVVLYELLTGEMLYQEDNIPALLDRVRKADVLPPSLRRPEVPTTLEEVVLKACAKKPEDRYQSAHEMSQALSTFLYTVSPSFSAQRLADYMGELFGEQVPKSGERKAPKAEARPAPPPVRADDNQTARLSAMSLADFSPKVNSVIFDLDDEEGETSADIEPYRRSIQDPTKELAKTDVEHKMVDEEEDEETLIHNRVAQDHWDATTSRKDGAWDDSTAVDDREELAIPPPRRLPQPPLGKRRPIPRATPPARPSAHPPPPAIPRPSAAAKSARPPAPPPPNRPNPVSPPVAPPPAQRPTFPKEAPGHAPVEAASPWPPPAVRVPSQAPAPAPAWPTPTPAPAPLAAAEPPTAEKTSIPAPGGSPTASLSAPNPFTARPDYVGETELLPRQRHMLLLRIALGVGAGLAVVALIVLIAVLTSGEPTPDSTVEVISVPSGASVLLDGTELPAVTPLVISDGLEIGRMQRIEVQLDGYEVWTTTFQPIDGTLKQIAVLSPLRATLHVRTEPAAHVWIDGVLFGSSPVEVPNREIGSEVHVRASLMGRDDVEQTVTITAADLNPTITLRLPDASEEP